MYVLRLKELRRAAGFKTQKEIADALGELAEFKAARADSLALEEGGAASA